MLKRYSLAFWLLNASTFLFFFSFNLLIPELPDYLTSLGGAEYKGFIIGLFTLMAALSRPVSGKLSDIIGRLPVMYIGGFVCVIAAVMYPIFTTVIAFMFIRVFHGFSTGFMPTGAMAYMADIIPARHRGEAMGISGIMNNLGFMAANGLSSFIEQSLGINNLFYLSGIIALIATAMLLKLPETLHFKRRFRLVDVLVKPKEVYDKRALDPTVVMFLTTLTFGTLLTILPDYSKSLGIMNKGLFLTISTFATIFVRLYAGRLSDRIGRLRTCIIGTGFWLITTLLLSTLNESMFYVAAVFTGLGTGMNSPALFAWAVDAADGLRAGRVMGTLFLGMELGITIGAFLSAYLYGNEFENLTSVFIFLSFTNLLALLYLFYRKRREIRV